MAESPSVTEFAWVVVPVLAVDFFVYMTVARATSDAGVAGSSANMQNSSSTKPIASKPVEVLRPLGA